MATAKAMPMTLLGIVALCAVGSGSGEQGATDATVKVGDHRLHLRESGSGRPVVVFENGMGEDLNTWNKIQPHISKLTRTVSYDRAGLGQSEPTRSADGRDATRLARELRAMLRAAHIQPPYVLVGHSLGGAIVQVFAHDYPADAGGLVLVDPGDGRLDALLRTKLPAEIWSARERALAEEMPNLPTAVRKEYEGLALSGEEVGRAFPLPRIPTILLTGTLKNPDFPGNPIEQELKLQLHNELAARVPGLEHILVPESRHYIQDDAPDAVISAIQHVLLEVQNKPPGTRR